MATPSKKNGWNFYLMGREERRLIKHEIDLELAAKRFVEQNEPLDPSWKEWLLEACLHAARSVSTRSKNEWLRENAAEIARSGMTENHAYDLYLAGRVDELRYALEGEFIESVAVEVDETAAVEDSVH